ncbi:MAG: hypothetical protein IH789_12525 [Acidobacteria bacterium]|nr:hypothetical protein [Acidobacteriota bacterium]
MKTLHCFRVLLLGLLAVVLTARAQEHQHPAGDVQKLGQVVFSTSCTAEVQEDFNRAVAMLHSFWYQTSEKAFAAVAQKDPSCAMAYWGIAMSRFHQLWEKPSPEDVRVGQTALEKAKTVGAESEREHGYINALEQFYKDADKLDHLAQMVAYEKAMEEQYRRYADDSEAAIFYALALLGTAYSSPPDKTYARQKKAGAILEKIFATQPNHPGVAHYIIHSYDYPPLAGRALEAARRYAKIAPEAPHALHMPSHIFTRLGLWQESIASNRAAAAAAHKDQWIGEELHATDYLTYAYLQGAQDGEARRILEELPKLREQLREDDSNYHAGVYATAAIPARYTVERRQWKEAAVLAAPADVFPGSNSCWAEASLYFARGLGAVLTGELADARHSIEQLEHCREVLLQANEELWVDLVEVQRRAVAAWLALAEGEKGEALAMMRSAADLEDSTDKPPITPGAIVPARELLGEMLAELERPAEALREYEAVLDNSPNRFNALYGAARAAELAGDMGKARDFYTKLAALGEKADSERAALSRAKAFLNNSQD